MVTARDRNPGPVRGGRVPLFSTKELGDHAGLVETATTEVGDMLEEDKHTSIQRGKLIFDRIPRMSEEENLTSTFAVGSLK